MSSRRRPVCDEAGGEEAGGEGAGPSSASNEADSDSGGGLRVPTRSPLRSSLVKDSSRRRTSPRPGTAPKTVSFSTMPTEKKISNVSDCLAHMQQGAELIKVRGNTRRYRRHFTLDADSSHIRWTPTNKKPHKAKIPIDQIKEIRVGRNTDNLRSSEACFEVLQEDCAFSIIWGEDLGVLDIVATSAEEANIWVTGLMALTSGRGGGTEATEAAAGAEATLRERWLRRLFAEAASSSAPLPSSPLSSPASPALSDREALRLIKSVAPRIAQSRILQKFKEVDSRKEESERGRMVEEEFVEVYKELATRPELYFLMVRSANKDYLNPEDLTLFLESEQGMLSVTREQSEAIIQEWEPSSEGREAGLMTIDGFTAFLMSEEGSLFDATHRAVCQDMTQPFHHYFIAASHNSYLIEDQLKGPASALGFARALKKGARFIEMDVWNGDDCLEAVVTHGHSSTSQLPVSKALATIRDFAFVSSSYPVVLKLEQHLSVIGQRALARQLRAVLGERLHLPCEEAPLHASSRSSLASRSSRCSANGAPEWPGPEAFKGCILIMSKKLPPGTTEAEGEVSEEDEAAETNKIALRNTRKTASKKMMLAKELSDLVPSFLVSTYVKDVNDISNSNLFMGRREGEVQNLGESICLRLGQSYPEDMTALASHSLCRVYPNAVRVDSSNLNPQEFWNYGVQIVGLNYQTPGLMMDLQEGKFSANGASGYVLKPQLMRDPLAHFSPRDKLAVSVSPQVLHLKVISAWQLVRPRGSSAKGHSADPYVVVEIFGVPPDCAEERTRTVHNDSFNPSWEESFQFQVAIPEVAILRFLVLDDDYIEDDFIGQYAIPFDCLQSGYRHITLRDNEGEELANSVLLVHVAVTNRRGGGKPRKRGMSVKRRATKIQTGVKALGVKALDDLFKGAIVPMTESITLKTGADLALTDWEESVGLGPAGSLRQGLRLLHSRFSTAVSDTPPDSDSAAAAFRLRVDDHGNPHVESEGPVPDQVRKALAALTDLVEKNLAIRKSMDGLISKVEEAVRRIGECGTEEIGGACAEAGLRGHKATRASENFAWNLRLLKGHLEQMHKTAQDSELLLRQVVDSACVLGLLREECKEQPCIHQARPTLATV